MACRNLRLASSGVIAGVLLASAAGGAMAAPPNFVVAGYASAPSCAPGDTVGIHVSANVSTLVLRVVRLGGQVTRMLEVPGLVPANVPVPDSAFSKGCRWPTLYTLTIPGNWLSGMYDLQILPGDEENDLNPIDETHIPLVVLGSPSAPQPVLILSSVSTAQAYNAFGGASLYDYNSPHGRASRVSFDRPYDSHKGLGQPQFEQPFARWFEQAGFQADYATDVDLALRPEILRGRRLLVVVGHSEYWSAPMAAAVAAFVDSSGNLAVFGANTCYWAVRYENRGRRLVCYKSLADPVFPFQPESTTVRFRDYPLLQPECHLLGVMYPGFQNAAADSVQLHQTYEWVTEGLEDKVGRRLGFDDLGYEWDAVCADDSQNHVIQIFQTFVNDPQFPGFQAGTYYERQPAFDYPANGGGIFDAGTVQWSWALDNSATGSCDPSMQRLTTNLLHRLSQSLKVGAAGTAVIRMFVSGADPSRPVHLSLQPAQIAPDGTKYAVTDMLDDGVWPDSIAGDGVFTGAFPLTEGQRLPLAISYSLTDSSGVVDRPRRYFWTSDARHADRLYWSPVDTLVVTPETSGVPPDEARAAAFRAWPVPFTTSVRLSWAPALGVQRLSFFDSAGRLVARQAVPAAASGMSWDGRGLDGRPAQAGIYWARAEGVRGTRTLRVIKLRS